jgi:hypothetical protein
MKRIIGFVFVALALGLSPAWAQLGSAVGGQAANQSSLSGGLCLSSPIAMTNGQQASLVIDCTTHALITEGAGGGGSSTANQGTPNAGGVLAWPVIPDSVSDAVTVNATGAAAGVLTGTPTPTTGYAVVDVDVQTLTAASLTPANSSDGGLTYRTVQCWPLNQNAVAPKISFNAAGGPWECPAGDHFQLTQVGAGASSVFILKKRAITAQGNSVQACLGTTCSNVGVPADGATASINALTTGALGSSFNGTTWDRSYYCNQSATISVTATNTTQIVALSASKIIRVCGFVASISLAGTAQFVYGTGTNCAVGTTNLTGAINIATGQVINAYGNPEVFRTASANAICLTAATGNVNGVLTYAQF